MYGLRRAIVGYIIHIVNKTLQGHILKHVLTFVCEVCFVLSYCPTHPFMTKAFANTLRLQNNTPGSFPRTETNMPSNCSHRKKCCLTK